MKICVMGLGYIGLPTCAVLAAAGVEVLGVDVQPRIVDTINKGKIHIEEPGLGELVLECVSAGRLRAAKSPEPADAFIIAVPTPSRQDELLSCDLTYVTEAVKAIIPLVQKGNVVIVESTIAPCCMDDEVVPVFEEAGLTPGVDFYLAHCPERVLPGRILHELRYNNRIVGGITPLCAEKAAEVYRTFVEGEIVLTEAKTAELSKCMENTFRDVNIALANELAKICGELGVNCYDVIRISNKHPRVNIHQPGPGVGGHCLAIDPYFVYAKAPETARLIKHARDINRSMPRYVADAVNVLLSGIKSPVISIFGTAYKGNVDDVRESPALEVIRLLAYDFELRIHDPHVNGTGYANFDEAISGSDLVLVLCDHDEFKSLDFDVLKNKMRRPVIFDTRNIVEEKTNSGVNVVNFGNLHSVKTHDLCAL